MAKEDIIASAEPLDEEQEKTLQDPQVEVTHPDSFARRQYETRGDNVPPDELSGSGNNPTAEQGGIGKKTEDMELDPSQEGVSEE